jgi:MSHA biogenesis protein MshM
LESLEALRLLTNLETERTKLLQVVLFGQPELDQHLAKPQLRQLDQRITFSYYLPLLTHEELEMYIFHRLAKAGSTTGTLFATKAKKLLYRASQGVPRIVNILCHKALLAAYGRGEKIVTKKIMRSAIDDTEFVATFGRAKLYKRFFLGVGLFICIILFIYYYEGIL